MGLGQPEIRLSQIVSLRLNEQEVGPLTIGEGLGYCILYSLPFKTVPNTVDYLNLLSCNCLNSVTVSSSNLNRIKVGVN